MRRFGLGLLAALLAALLAGCATVRPPAPAASDATPQRTANHSGRLSLRVAASPGRPAQNLAADFELTGTDQQGELKLFSPLGTVMAQAVWQPGSATLNVVGNAPRQFASLDDLSEQALGEPVPLAALPHWLAGKPWPLAISATQLQGFEQLGWQIDLSQFSQGRLSALRIQEPAVSLRITLDSKTTSQLAYFASERMQSIRD